VLLDGAERGLTGEVLRFWESPVPFAVLGVAQAVRQEVRLQECEEAGLAVLRRCSAGGCVLQGQGCLNYSLVLEHAHRPEIRTIRGSYCYILGRISEQLRKRDLTVRHNGVSDLSLGGKKVSGNSQKRRKRYMLHHGTLLYGLEPEDMEQYLREPADRPRYRGDRTHRGFVRNLPLGPDELREVVREAFDVDDAVVKPNRFELDETAELAQEKYTAAAWTLRR